MKILLAFILFTFTSNAVANTWHEYKSENFVVYSDHDSQYVETLIRDFEVYRKAVLLFFGLEDAPENQYARIYLFKSKLEYKRLDTGSSIAGFYINDDQGPIMVTGAFKKKRDSRLVMFHEYVHYLTRERSNLVFPKWYDEGVSDLLGAARVKDGIVSIGNSNPWRHQRSSRGARTSVSKLITPPARQNYKYYAYFYPSSWILTHYLYLSSLSGGEDYSAKLKQYLRVYQGGDHSIETFEKVMGTTAEELDKAVDEYSKRGTLTGFNIPVGNYKKKITKRTLSINESIYIRTKLLLTVEEEYKARYLLRKTEENKAFSGINYALYAVSEASKGDLDEAKTLMDKALKIESNNPEIQAQLVNYHLQVLKHLKDEDNWDKTLYQKALSHGRKTLTNTVSQGYVASYLSGILRLGGEHKEAISLLMELYQKNRNSISLNRRIALYLIEIGSPKLAKTFLEHIVTFSHSKKYREEAIDLLEKHGLLDAKTASNYARKNRYASLSVSSEYR